MHAHARVGARGAMDGLPDELLILALSGVEGRWLARLECTSRRFASLGTATHMRHRRRECMFAQLILEPEPEPFERAQHLEQTAPTAAVAVPAPAAYGAVPGLAELAAGVALSRRSDAARIVLRPGEKRCFALHVLECLLAGPAKAAAGSSHSVIVSAPSTAATFGIGTQGQLGHSHDASLLAQPLHGVMYSIPKVVRIGADAASVCCVAAGTAHSLISTVMGEVFSCGDSSGGRLGIGNISQSQGDGRYCPAPVRVPGRWRDKVVLVSAGSMHSACVTATGELWTWGDGSCGMLGHGPRIFGPSGSGDSRTGLNCCQPQRVESLSSQRIVSLSCGARTTAAVTASGLLFMCGRLPRQGVGDVAMGFDAPEDDHEEDVDTPVQIAGLHGCCVQCVACGPSHYAAVSRCGKLFTWVSQFLLPRSQAFPYQTDLVDQYLVYLNYGLLVWGQGDAWDGKLGHGAARTQMHVGEPRMVTSFLRDQEQQQQLHQQVQPESETGREIAELKIVSVGCGIRHTAALSADGELYTFGHNMCGQLGHGHRTECQIPCLVHVASDDHGRGRDQAEQTVGASTPLAGVLSVTCGGYHTIATVAVAHTQGTAPSAPAAAASAAATAYQHYVWGYGEEGQLGLTDPPVHSVLVPRLLPQAIA